MMAITPLLQVFILKKNCKMGLKGASELTQL